MARTIDGDELLGIERLLDTDVVRKSKTASWLLDQVLHDIQAMPTLTPPNEPLTLDELREMDGEPVWDEKGKCYLVDTTYQFCSDSDIEIAIVDKRSIKRYPYRRTLYRRPPEGEVDGK